MDRDDLIAEIKKQLQEELQYYIGSLENKIPEEHKQQAKKIKNTSTDFIQKNPLISVALASVLAFLVAKMIYQQKDET